LYLKISNTTQLSPQCNHVMLYQVHLDMSENRKIYIRSDGHWWHRSS